MYAHLVRADDVPRLGEVVTGELVPGLLEEPGFAGALVLAGDEGGVIVLLWDSVEDARRAEALLDPFASGSPREIWRVCARV